MSELTDDPDEIVTLAYCYGCEQMSLAGDLETRSPGGTTGDQLVCPRCSVRINAEMFHDYADLDVVDYE